MKIKELKISNILSFGYKADFENTNPDIVFDDNMNIIVGANGSGKSNFIEILFTLFRGYFTESYKYIYGFETDKINNPFYITKRRDSGANLKLYKHSGFESNESLINLKVELSENDKKNLNFIKNNSKALEILLAKFPIDERNPFEGKDFLSINVDSVSEVTFDFQVINEEKRNKVKFILKTSQLDPERDFVNFYLKNLDLIKKLIETSVTRKLHKWDNLYFAFEFFGSQRNLNSFHNIIDLSPGQDNRINDFLVERMNTNIKIQSDSHQIFGATNSMIGNSIRKDIREKKITIEEAIEYQFTNQNAPYYKLNILLYEYLGLSLRHTGIPTINSDSLVIEIYDCKSTNKVEFNDLSSGQKSIFTLIYLVITSNLDNGFLVIDEPEIHLHPSMQRKYFELLKIFSDSYNLQTILITHSPIFIDERTIKNTFRFYIENNVTKIIKGNNIDAKDQDLIRFLSYTNSSKVFFTNKVILVEGDSDSYFFTYLKNNHYKVNQEIEFLYIGGKDNYKRWFDFLDKFKINRFFITDFDFIDKPAFKGTGIDETREKLATKDLNITLLKLIKKEPKLTKNQIMKEFNNCIISILSKSIDEISEDDLLILKKGGLIEKQKLVTFREITKEIEKIPRFKNKIDNIIKNLTFENIYVLRWGDLEEYLSISKNKKGLQSVVEYCSDNRFSSMEDNLKENLRTIFEDIYSH